MYAMHEPNYPVMAEDLDDVDRVYARLDRAAVPDDLTARVLASTVAGGQATRTVVAWPWMVAGLAALCVLSLAGYQIGMRVATSGGLELVAALAEDLGMFTTAPGDVVAALGEVIPWSLVALAVLGAVLVVFAAGRIVSRAPVPHRARQIA